MIFISFMSSLYSGLDNEGGIESANSVIQALFHSKVVRSLICLAP